MDVRILDGANFGAFGHRKFHAEIIAFPQLICPFVLLKIKYSSF
jgi:hypothetical protein